MEKRRRDTIQLRMEAKDRASQQVVDDLIITHEKELEVVRRQLRGQESLNDELRHGQAAGEAAAQAERMRAAIARARERDEAAQRLASDVATLRERLRAAEDGQRLAHARSADSDSACARMDAQMDACAGTLRRSEAEAEAARRQRRQEHDDHQRQLADERRVTKIAETQQAQQLEEQERRIEALQTRLRRHDEQREAAEPQLDELRANDQVEPCIVCIESLQSQIIDLEESLTQAKGQRDRLRRDKDEAVREMERAIEKETEVMARYLKVLAARDGVLQRGRDLDRRAWEVSLHDKSVERREVLLQKREVEAKRAGLPRAEGARRLCATTLPALRDAPTCGSTDDWQSRRLAAADGAVSLPREQVYTQPGALLPAPNDLPPQQPPARDDARTTLLHRPLRPLRHGSQPDTSAGEYMARTR